MTPRDENRRFIIRSWLMVAASLVAFAASTFCLAQQYGAWATLMPVALVGIYVWMYFVQPRRFARLYRADGPEALLKQTEGVGRYVPNRDWIVAAARANTLAWFGRFDEARDALGSVDWNDAPTIFHAIRWHTSATIALFAGDYEMAVRDATRGARLGDVPRGAPGGKTTERAHRATVLIAEALSDPESTTLDELEAMAATRLRPYTLEMLVRWGLASVWAQRGDEARAHPHRVAYRELCPHGVAPLGEGSRVPYR